MIPRSHIFISKIFILTLAIGVALLGCSPSDPKLTDSGIDAVGAIALFDKAQSSQERDQVLTKIKTHRRVGFDWVYLWRALAENDRPLKFTEPQLEQLFSLSSDSCFVESFQAFSNLVLRMNRGFEFVFGVKKSCALPLSDETFLKYVKFFTGRVWPTGEVQTLATDATADARRLGELLISQVQSDSRTDKTPILRSLTSDGWLVLIERLLQVGEASLASNLVQAHQNQFGGIRFLDAMIHSLLTRPQSLKVVLAKNPLLDVLRILTADPALKITSETVTAENWQQVFDLLAEKFTTEVSAIDHALFENALNSVHLLELLPERAAAAPPFQRQLKWHENILRTLERSVRGQAHLLDSSHSHPVALWLKLRFKQSLSTFEEVALQTAASGARLSQALLFKLRLRAFSDQSRLGEKIHEYCQWLAANQVPERSVPGPQFEWAMTGEPGCLHLSGNTSAADTLTRASAEPIEMALDSVLYSSGWNLKLTAPFLDGAFLDLSTTLQHPDLPAEPPEATDHAVAFPLLMGIRMASMTTLPHGAGTYYFIFHHTWRKATAGRPAKAQPLRGFPGGTLNLVTEQPELTTDPMFYSAGGPGQKGVPPRVGGNSSLSEVQWSPLAEELQALEAQPDLMASKPIPAANVAVRVLHELLVGGEVDAAGQTRLFIEPGRLLKHIPEVQRAKALSACPNPTDLSCWESVTLKGAMELWSRYSATCPQVGQNRVCDPQALDQTFDRLSSVRFEEPAGALGPVNPDGEVGSNGQFNQGN